MLNEQDKQWIANLFAAGRKSDREWMENELNEVRVWMQAKLDGVLVELTHTMAEGFSECASASQLVEVREEVSQVQEDLSQVQEELSQVQEQLVGVKANIGSLEQRFKWMSECMVTKEDLDERLDIHKVKEEERHKQHTQKLVRLTQTLRNKKLISTDQANVVLAMEPFPQKISSRKQQ